MLPLSAVFGDTYIATIECKANHREKIYWWEWDHPGGCGMPTHISLLLGPVGSQLLLTLGLPDLVHVHLTGPLVQ